MQTAESHIRQPGSSEEPSGEGLRIASHLKRTGPLEEATFGTPEYETAARATATESATTAETMSRRVVVAGVKEQKVSSAENIASSAPKQTPNRPVATVLAEYEQLALSRHPGLQELQSRIDALQGKWLQVGLRPNTHLGFSGQQLFSNGEAEQIGLVMGQQVVRQTKLDWNRQVVCRELEVAQQEFQTLWQRVLTDVRQAYFQVLIAQRRVMLLDQLSQIAQQAVTAAQSLQAAGEGTQIDVLRATVEQQATAVELTNAHTSLAAARNRFVAVLAAPEMSAAELSPAGLAGDELLAALSPDLAEVDAAEYWARLQQESPELLAALAEQERAHASWQRARVEAQPDVDIESVVQYDQGTGGTNANLQVSMPIPWRDWNQGGMQQTRSEWLAAQQAVQRLEQNLQQRLADVYRSFENSRQQVSAYQAADGMIANSQRSLELIDAAYRAGEISFIDLLTAQRTNAQTNLLYLNALEQYWNSHWELKGQLLKGSLE